MSIFGWVAGKLNDLIEGALNKWIEEFMNWVLALINKLVFNLPSSSFVNDVMTFLFWFTGVFATVVVGYKILEYIINTMNGTQQYPLGEIIVRIFKSAVAMLVLPWFLNILMLDIALPIANYFSIAGTNFHGKGGAVAMITTGLVGLGGLAGATVSTGGIVLIIVLLFFAIVFGMFFYSVCVFYADYIVMQILIAPVALSMIADENNYFQVWWRELLSIVTSLLIKLFLVTLVINTIFSGGNLLLAIGAGALIIKTPSVIKNMWYAGGGSRGVSRGMGVVGAMGSRAVLTKLFSTMSKGGA